MYMFFEGEEVDVIIDGKTYRGTIMFFNKVEGKVVSYVVDVGGKRATVLKSQLEKI